MNRDTKHKFFEAFLFVVIVVLLLLLFKSCDNTSINSSASSGGGSVSSGAVLPECRSGFHYVVERCECVPDPCPVGYVGVLQAGYTSCVRNPVGNVLFCEDVKNPLSQRDCDNAVCSSTRSVCTFVPAVSGTAFVPAHCGC